MPDYSVILLPDIVASKTMAVPFMFPGHWLKRAVAAEQAAEDVAADAGYAA